MILSHYVKLILLLTSFLTALHLQFSAKQKNKINNKKEQNQKKDPPSQKKKTNQKTVTYGKAKEITLLTSKSHQACAISPEPPPEHQQFKLPRIITKVGQQDILPLFFV